MDDTSWTRLVDPAATLGAVLAATRPSPGDVVVARVDIESQRVTGNRTLRPPAPALRIGDSRHDDEQAELRRIDMSGLVRQAAEGLAAPHTWQADGRGGYRGLFVTLVCRKGRVVDTRHEWDWTLAWRYSNHFRDGFDAGVYAVTPHGWTGVLDMRSGVQPRLRARPALSIAT